MAMRTLPHWYAQPRGTAITSLAVLDGDGGGDEGSFLSRLGDRLTNLVDGGPAAVIGFLVVLSMLMPLPAAGVNTPWLAAVLSLIPIGFCAAACLAGLLVFREGEDALPGPRASSRFSPSRARWPSWRSSSSPSSPW